MKLLIISQFYSVKYQIKCNFARKYIIIYCFMRYTYLYVFLGVLCLSLNTFARQKNILEVEDYQNDFFITNDHIEVYEDFEKRLSLSDVLLPENQKYFKTQNTSDNFPYLLTNQAVYWIKVTVKLKKPTTKRWVLENQDLHIDQFEFYKIDGGHYIKQDAGYALNFGVRDYEHKNFVFDLPLDTFPQTFYIKASAKNKYVLKLKIRTGSFFTSYALKEYFALGIFYGIILIMAAYNLFVYFSVKEKVYLYYVAYALSCCLIALSEDGLGFQFIWPQFYQLNHLLAMFSPLLLLLSFSLYSKEFLELKKNYPKINIAVNFTLTFSVLFFIIRIFFLNLDWHFPFYLLPFLVIYIGALYIMRAGQRTVRFFLVAYTFMLLGIILLILRLNNIMILGSSIITVYSFNIGLVLEVVILSYALSDRIGIIKQEREEALKQEKIAQKQMIEQLTLNEKLKDNLNKELEAKVLERTLELKEKNEEIATAFDKLNEQSAEIARINALLNKENVALQHDVQEISKARVLMQDIDVEEFSKIFPDKETCYLFLSDLKWKNGYTCIKCANNKFCDGRDYLSKRCTKCRHDESPTANTIFHKLKFPVTKAFYMLYLIYATKEKITTVQLSEILELRQSTCWSFNKKINDVIERKRKNKEELDGWSSLILETTED